MDKDQLYSELKKIMAELFEIDPTEITLTANLYEDLDIDSIDAVDLIVKMRQLTGKSPTNPILRARSFVLGRHRWHAIASNLGADVTARKVAQHHATSLLRPSRSHLLSSD